MVAPAPAAAVAVVTEYWFWVLELFVVGRTTRRDSFGAKHNTHTYNSRRTLHHALTLTLTYTFSHAIRQKGPTPIQTPQKLEAAADWKFSAKAEEIHEQTSPQPPANRIVRARTSPFLYSRGQSSSSTRGFSIFLLILECVTSLLNMTPSITCP